MNYIDRDNPVFSEPIQSPAAWTGSEIGGKAGVSRRLTVAQIETLWDLVERTRHRALTDATRADFADPFIDRLMHDVRHELIHGKGVVLLSGLDLGGRSIEDFGRLYWGLGTYVGTAAVNNRGERLCRVQYETDDRVAGVGYLRNIELLAHTDYHEVLGLAAYQRAETGGETGLVSSLAIHNTCLQERPAYLKALYEGYFHVAPGSDQVLPQKAPLFSNVGGTISFSTHFRQYHEAAARLGQQLPSELMAALDFVQEVASRPELRVTFTLEPGEILFWHNFTLLHSRTAFANSEDRKRLLLRLWLNVPDGRAMHFTFHERARNLDRMNEEAATRKSPT